MSYYRNLIPGQIQLGDIVMGRGTNIVIEAFDVKPYDVNIQDYQVVRSDSIRMGSDFWKPTTIEMQLNVLYNRLLPGHEHLIPNFWNDMPRVENLAEIWAYDSGRKIWGSVMPLYYCGRDGIGKIVYGRPGQFTSEEIREFSDNVGCVAEFRRSDVYNYGTVEKRLLLSQATNSAVIPGTAGNAPSWLKILVRGPINNMQLAFSNLVETPEPYTVELNKPVAAGEVIEISSYEWERRAVSSTGENVAPYMGGDTPYLDRLKVSPYEPCTVTVSGGATTSQTAVIVMYRDAYRTL